MENKIPPIEISRSTKLAGSPELSVKWENKLFNDAGHLIEGSSYSNM